jgi:hypothetical protein
MYDWMCQHMHVVFCVRVCMCRYGTLEFSAGVVQLARVLAREPRVGVEVWHKER